MSEVLEKRRPLLDEEKVDSFLDAILDFKNLLSEKTEAICEINQKLEKLTWLGDLDEECLMLLNDLIASAKDLHTFLVRQYVAMNAIRKKGITKEEVNEFKNAIDELKETYSDLASVFFFLPKMPEFVETTKQLSLIE